MLAAGLVAVAATGLGAAPLAAFRRPTIGLVALANAGASGVMLSIGLSLLVEGVAETWLGAITGAVIGVAFVLAVRRSLPERLLEPGWLQGADTRKAFLVVGAMAAHSLAEGVAVGSAFGISEARGVATTVALAAHKTIEGFVVGLVLVSRGARTLTAVAWSLASAVPLAIVAVLAFIFVDAFTAVLPLVLGFAAGAMASVVVADLLPEAAAHASPARVAVATVVAFSASAALQLALP